MRRATWIALAALALGCGGGESAPAVRTVGVGGTHGMGGAVGVAGASGSPGTAGSGGNGGTVIIVPLSGLWSFEYPLDGSTFCFYVSADGTRLEAADSPCGPDLAVWADGGLAPCSFTVSIVEDVPIVNNGFFVEGQMGDTVECAFLSSAQLDCEIHDAQGECIRDVHGQWRPQ